MDPRELAALHTRIQSIRAQNKRPAFSYDRISDEVQSDGVSLDAQSQHSAQYALTNKLTLAHSFQMVESAHKEGRRVFGRMLDLASELGVRDLIFKNVDRMSRNYQDLVRIEKLIDSEGFSIHFYQTNLTISQKSSYNDRFIIGIQLAVSKHTSDKISQDVREANLFKAERGTGPFPSPFGYRYNRADKRHEIDPNHEASCRFLFDRFDKDDISILQLAELLNERGIRTQTGGPWGRGGLHYLLANPFYHGEFRYHGRLWPGTQPPYYPKQRFEERRRRMSDRFYGERKRLFEFHYARFIRCECGLGLTGEIKKGRYIYYRHVCPKEPKQVYVREPALMELLDGIMKGVWVSPELGDFLRKVFREYRKHRVTTSDDRVRAAQTKLARLKKRKQRLLDLYASERIPRQDLEVEIDRIQAEIGLSEHGHFPVGPSDDEVLARIEDIVRAFEVLPLTYAGSDEKRKAKIWRWVAAGAVVNTRGTRIVQVRWKRPFDLFLKHDVARRMGNLQEELAGGSCSQPAQPCSPGWMMPEPQLTP